MSYDDIHNTLYSLSTLHFAKSQVEEHSNTKRSAISDVVERTLLNSNATMTISYETTSLDLPRMMLCCSVTMTTTTITTGRCIVLYCIVLYCIVFVLYCTVLYCVVLYCIVLYCIVLYCTGLDWIVLYCIVLSNITNIISIEIEQPRLTLRSVAVMDLTTINVMIVSPRIMLNYDINMDVYTVGAY